MDRLKELSVFLPAFNEEKNIESVSRNVLRVLPEVAERYELIIVNDGSQDGTLSLANRLAEINPAVKVLNHEKNLGYGASLRSGFYSSRFEWVVFTDADGQFDFSEISWFIECQKKTASDLIVGYYLKRSVPLYRKVNSFLWQFLILVLFGLRLSDIDCGFKMISRRVIEKIPVLESERGAFISTELLVKSKKLGFKIAEVGVRHYPRKSGKATGANFNVILKSFVDLFRLWEKLK